MRVNKSDIVNEFIACPYCGNRLGETWHACCGEAGHGERAYETASGDVYLDSEIEIIDDAEDTVKFLQVTRNRAGRIASVKDITETYRENPMDALHDLYAMWRKATASERA